jgi:hypothetical protein
LLVPTRVFTRRLFGGQVLGTDPVVVYTVPDGFTAIVRDIVISSEADPGCHFAIFLNIPAGNVRILDHELTLGQTAHLELRQALIPGEGLVVWKFTGAAGAAAITGYVFELP